MPLAYAHEFRESWKGPVNVYRMEHDEDIAAALGRRSGKEDAIKQYVEKKKRTSVFAADPAVRARCEATSAENLKMKAAMKAEFLEQEKAKVRGIARQLRLLRALALTRCVCVPPLRCAQADAAAASSAVAAAGPDGGELRPLAASAAPADAGTRASDEPALAGALAHAASVTAVAQPAVLAPAVPTLAVQPQPQAVTAPLTQSTVFVLGRAVKRPAEDLGASGSGAKKQRTEQQPPAVSRVAPPVAVLHPQALPTASAPAAVAPDAASGNALHQALDDAAAEPPALHVAAVDDSLQRAHLAACTAAREKAEKARNSSLSACPAAQTALLAAIEAQEAAEAELEQAAATHAAAAAKRAAARAAAADAEAEFDATEAAFESKRTNLLAKAAAAQAAEKASNRATAAAFKLNADLSAAKRAEKTVAAALIAAA